MPHERALRPGHPRHAHDGHDGRRRRRSGPNQIGVAPHAKWIAAKGCCLDTALISSAQWILAPTNLAGTNPRPDLRPDVVNNSWGGGSGDPFFRPAVQAWVASGIFPAFSNGNSGPACGSAGSPGDYPETYSAGAFQQNGSIASFSARGPSAFGDIIKPDIAAPGVNVRSSLNGSDSSYGPLSGTSMASPHLAGTVALIWSISPELRNDVARTRTLLAQTAVDVSNTSCGGTAGYNNVWGEGKLDALAAVTAAPRGLTGSITGTVTRSDTNAPIGGAEVRVTGPANRSVATDPTGHYSMTLPVGTYTVEVTAHGYTSESISNAQIVHNGTLLQDFSLDPAPVLTHDLTTLIDQNGNGKIEPGESFQIDERLLNTGFASATGISAVLSSTTPGISITQPSSAYPDVAAGGTGTNSTHFAGIASDSLACGLLIDFQLAVTTAQGSFSIAFTAQGGPPCYDITQQTGQPIIPGTTNIGNSCDDCTTPITLPFPVTFYGESQTQAVASSNGNLQFGGTRNTAFINNCLPTGALQSAVVVYWDDLLTTGGGHGIFTATTGSPPNRQFVVEWRTGYANRSGSADFEAIFNEGSDVIRMRYGVDVDHGASVTVGLQGSPTRGDQFSCNTGTLGNPDLQLTYTPTSGPPPPPPPSASATATSTSTTAATTTTSATATPARHRLQGAMHGAAGDWPHAQQGKRRRRGSARGTARLAASGRHTSSESRRVILGRARGPGTGSSRAASRSNSSSAAARTPFMSEQILPGTQAAVCVLETSRAERTRRRFRNGEKH